MYQNILVPLDGSKLAELALPHAESLAGAFGARLLLLSVVQPQLVVGRAPADIKLFQDQLDTLDAETADYLKGLKGSLAKKNIAVETSVKYGPVVEEIVEMAERHRADLVVMASHGRSGLGRVFFGSVAAGVLNRVRIPLLMVRPRDG